MSYKQKTIEALEAYQGKYKGLSASVVAGCIQVIRELPEDAEKNDPLTLGELREMDAPIWCLCEPIEGGNGFWCLCQKGHIITPAGNCFAAEEIPHWAFLRHKPKED